MNRDLRIDFLRFLGLSLVIVAHVQAPFTLTQIRSFDVPLMVFVSGLTASGKEISNYWQYIWRRSKRLIVPVWLFLAIYLSFFYIVQNFILPEPYLTGRMIVRSFLLLDESIGYVWIIRVFLLVMFLTPLVLKFSRMIHSDLVYMAIIVILLLLNQVSFQLSVIMEAGLAKEIVEDFVVYGIAYSAPYSLGVRLKDANNKSLLFFLFSIGLILLLFINNSIVAGNNPLGVSAGYKFPPRPYFIAYGSLISVLLWATRKWWGKLANNSFTSFIGQNTIWIYLWHMPFALMATVFMHNWLLKYIIVYGGALLLFWLQFLIVNKQPNKEIKKYLLG